MTEAPVKVVERQDPRVTVVIPTRNRESLIRGTLESVIQLEYPAFDILVVDQSDGDDTGQIVRHLANLYPNLHYRSTKSIGSSISRNIGATLSNTDFVAFTDDDCIVEAHWLAAIMQEFSNPEVSAVYGRVLPYQVISRTGSEAAVRDGERRIAYRGRVPPWRVGTGGNMAFRRQDLLAIGGFDVLLGAGSELQSCEDTDVAYRLLTSGYQLVYTPAAVTYHKQWKDWHSQKQMERGYGVGAGAQYAKYVRSGDFYGLYLFFLWMWQLGVRRLASGVIKWRNWRVVYLGYCQLTYPWYGVLKSLRFPVDQASMTFSGRAAEAVSELKLSQPYETPSEEQVAASVAIDQTEED